MNYEDWKAKHGHEHISDREKSMLDECKSLEAHAHMTVSQTLHKRLAELKDFAESVEKVLKAEWRHFVDCLEGKHNEYN